MSLNLENPEEVRAWVKQTCETIEVLGYTVAAQQDRIEALEALLPPFSFPIVAPQPVRDISIGEAVDNPRAQPL